MAFTSLFSLELHFTPANSGQSIGAFFSAITWGTGRGRRWRFWGVVEAWCVFGALAAALSPGGPRHRGGPLARTFQIPPKIGYVGAPAVAINCVTPNCHPVLLLHGSSGFVPLQWNSTLHQPRTRRARRQDTKNQCIDPWEPTGEGSVHNTARSN